MESMHRRARHNGDEYDAYAPKRTRDREPAFSRAGVRAKTKRRTHKRERATARQLILSEV